MIEKDIKPTPAQAKRMRRHEKVCRLWHEKKDAYPPTQLYYFISRRTGYQYQSVIRILQDRGLVPTKEEKLSTLK